MKTGGTSLNRVIQCALNRQMQVDKQTSAHALRVPYYSVTECAFASFQQCMSGKSPQCIQQANRSMVMQYCAPLFAVNRLGWAQADLVTVLRHPVDRVWSMYRFRTRSCYKCLSLKEVYAHIDNGTTDQVCGTCQSICMTQVGNHLTRNLILSDPEADHMSDEDMLAEALHNLRNVVALVGVTEELGLVHQMLGRVFPWLNETVENSTSVCALPHANGSPPNNGCGKNNKHMPLPDEPDAETRELIMKHSQLDMVVYQEAKRLFHLQKLALGLGQLQA